MNNREAIEYASKYSFLALYEKGKSDLLKSIRECAEHLGYDDVEDLLSYVAEKEQENE